MSMLRARHVCVGWAPAFASLLALIFAACGGVKQLDPLDKTLPEGTREWVAQSEDGVVAARARLEVREEALERMKAWRKSTKREARGSLAGPHARYADVRVRVSELERRQAEAAVVLAVAKNDLLNAERAVVLDRARYELDPLREEVAEARDLLAGVRKRLEAARTERTTAEAAFWKAYGAQVGDKKDARLFWQDTRATADAE